MNPLCSVLRQKVGGTLHILDELILPDSNTLAACEEFLSRTKPWTTAPEVFDPPLPPDAPEGFQEMLMQLQPRPFNVYIYGDATGEQRRTSASRTDWQILKGLLWPLHGPLPRQLARARRQSAGKGSG